MDHGSDPSCHRQVAGRIGKGQYVRAGGRVKEEQEGCGGFQMPLHYPRYSRSEYETMPEGQLDRLLTEYGLPMVGNVEQKRKFAMGAFLWPR
ncbi:hypothetical protein NC652_028774 [Populus alba x Populus x berolinensis]|nr:hypothetical protein NC652_028774 [Populus alba x Populus x berolinensis]